MPTLKELCSTAEELAPLELSYKTVAKGGYDNSGIIVDAGRNVNKILFSLDLSEAAVNRAKRLGCDTVVTHHPAIYMPIKNLSATELVNPAVFAAVRAGINVLSMHLNLDIAEGGIDASLAEALGATETRFLDVLEKGDPRYGYGREFVVNAAFAEVIARAKKNLKTDRIIVYGNKKDTVKICASFCGGGSGYAETAVKTGETEADLIVTSDMPHHVIKELVEAGKKIMLVTHYAAENYGFEKFYGRMTEKLSGRAETFYFEDKRFL
mgnify:FL=1